MKNAVLWRLFGVDIYSYIVVGTVWTRELNANQAMSTSNNNRLTIF